MGFQYNEPCSTNNTKKSADKETEENVVFKHDKDGLSIYITIYNTNNNANEDGQAGLKQDAETGGQISSDRGSNANQGGQITGKCGQNANQDSDVSGTVCGSTDETAESTVQQHDEETAESKYKFVPSH